MTTMPPPPPPIANPSTEPAQPQVKPKRKYQRKNAKGGTEEASQADLMEPKPKWQYIRKPKVSLDSQAPIDNPFANQSQIDESSQIPPSSQVAPSKPKRAYTRRAKITTESQNATDDSPVQTLIQAKRTRKATINAERAEMDLIK